MSSSRAKYLTLCASILCTVWLFSPNQIFGQCTVGGQTDPGFYTSSGTQLLAAMPTDSVYADTITWVPVPEKPLIFRGSQIIAPMLWYFIDSISGLPDGFTYSCNTANCYWTYSSDSSGCIVIEGDPSMVSPGTYNLTIHYTMWVNAPTYGAGIPLPIHKTETGLGICIESANMSAGPDQFLCNETFTNLNASCSGYCAGWWSVVSGGAYIWWPESKSSFVSGLSVGENVFRWTMNNGVCGVVHDEVTVTVYPGNLTLSDTLTSGTYRAVDTVFLDGIVVCPPDSVTILAGAAIIVNAASEIKLGASLVQNMMDTCMTVN